METSADLQQCPQCGQASLRTVYDEDTGAILGANCNLCSYRAYFLESEQRLVSVGKR